MARRARRLWWSHSQTLPTRSLEFPPSPYAFSLAQGSGGILLGLAGAGAGLYAAREQGYLDTLLGAPSNKIPTAADYAKVRSAIADVLDSDTHDDGSYGPILVRLAWHTSGTYDKATGTGGSNGATMRFNPESGWGANAGLKTARDVLEPVKKAFPWISYADLWTLAGAVAIEEMGGPEIPWRPGRSDKEEKTHVPLPDGRLPDGDKGSDHVRDIFYRMGFNDQEIVALVGAHALGRCHPTSSGWDGPWTRAPTTFSNEYFVQLADNKWKKKKWSGPEQYEDPTGDLCVF